MQKITLFVEDGFVDILQDFKKFIGGSDLPDDKALILVTRYFMANFIDNPKREELDTFKNLKLGQSKLPFKFVEYTKI